MKKTYQNPSTRVVKLNPSCHLLTNSEVRYRGNYDSEKVTIGSRRGSTLWDDEEE